MCTTGERIQRAPITKGTGGRPFFFRLLPSNLREPQRPFVVSDHGHEMECVCALAAAAKGLLFLGDLPQPVISLFYRVSVKIF